MPSLRAATLAIYYRECKAELTKAVRMPSFLIPTIVLPPAFYALFAIGMGRGNIAVATHALATFGVFSVMGPALFGFGASVAAERESNQLELKRLSPMPAAAHVLAKLFAAIVLIGVALAIIYGMAIAAGVRLEPRQWASLLLLHLFSVVPFALIGLSLGYRLPSKSAVAAANLLFIGLAVLGGLWMPISLLPRPIQAIAWGLPSFHLGELALIISGQAPTVHAWLHACLLALITMAAAVFARTGQAREVA